MPLPQTRKVFLIGGPRHGRVLDMNSAAAIIKARNHAGHYDVRPWCEHASGVTLCEAHFQPETHHARATPP